MKILVLGAGATGGYFGGRLAASGADIAFLVRERRAAKIAVQGIVIESPFGNAAVPARVFTSARDAGVQDVIILSCKFYDLEDAMRTIAPAVGGATLILPLLNGVKHLDALDAAFGMDRVLGGSCHLSVTLGDDGVIRHFNQLHVMTFGPRTPAQAARCEELLALMKGGGFEPKLRPDILQAMWDKWVLLAALASTTCLFRASIGEIVSAPAGRDVVLNAIEECRMIAAAEGFEPSQVQMATTRSLLTDSSSNVVASMLRDMQKGARIEADLILDDLILRGRKAGLATPFLDAAAVNLACYAGRKDAVSREA